MSHYSFQIKPELRPYIWEAHDYFYQEYSKINNGSKPQRLKALKYFKALEWVYEGHSREKLAQYFEVTESSIRDKIHRCQMKTEQYLELKKIGRL